MNTNDQTSYMNSADKTQYAQVNDANQPVADNGNKKSNGWKTVTLGGVVGVLMGAGGIAYAHPQETEDNGGDLSVDTGKLLVAESVNDDMSFMDAFNAAREEVGPGGVFTWHGGVYNTYTLNEWNSMSEEDRDQFCHGIRPEVGVDQIDTAHMTAEAPEPVVVVVHEHDDQPQAPEAVSAAHQTDVVLEPVDTISTEPEIHLIGRPETMVAEDGTIVTIQHLEADGHDGFIADLNGDMVPDIAGLDANNNGEVDFGEIIDLQTGEPIGVGAPESGPVYADNPDVAPDAPDYINDASIDVVNDMAGSDMTNDA